MVEGEGKCGKGDCNKNADIIEIEKYGPHQIEIHFCDDHWLVHQIEIHERKVHQPELQIVQRLNPQRKKK